MEEKTYDSRNGQATVKIDDVRANDYIGMIKPSSRNYED